MGIDGYELDKDLSASAVNGLPLVDIDGQTYEFNLYYRQVAPVTPEYVTVRCIYTVEGEIRDYVYAEEQVPYGSAYSLKTGFEPIDSFVFSGWSTNADLSKLTADCEVRGHYTPDPNAGKYYVEQYLQNLDGTYSMAGRDLVTGVAVDAVIAADSKSAKNFSGFKYDHAEGSVIASIYAEQSGTIKVYYARNSYTVTYMVDGKQSGKTETYKFGAPVTVRSAPNARKGYTFVGWDADVALGSGGTMPASNVIFSGTMVPGDGVKYTVNFYLENDAGKYELYESSERTGVVGKLTTVKAPKIDGYKAQAFTNKIIAGDGSTVVNVYYDLIAAPYVPNRPTPGGDKTNIAPIETLDVQGGQPVQLPEDTEEPSISAEQPDVENIGEEETPLASGESGLGFSIIPFIILGILIVAAAVYVLVRHKKEAKNA